MLRVVHHPFGDEEFNLILRYPQIFENFIVGLLVYFEALVLDLVIFILVSRILLPASFLHLIMHLRENSLQL